MSRTLWACYKTRTEKTKRTRGQEDKGTKDHLEKEAFTHFLIIKGEKKDDPFCCGDVLGERFLFIFSGLVLSPFSQSPICVSSCLGWSCPSALRCPMSAFLPSLPYPSKIPVAFTSLLFFVSHLPSPTLAFLDFPVSSCFCFFFFTLGPYHCCIDFLSPFFSFWTYPLFELHKAPLYRLGTADKRTCVCLNTIFFSRLQNSVSYCKYVRDCDLCAGQMADRCDNE